MALLGKSGGGDLAEQRAGGSIIGRGEHSVIERIAGFDPQLELQFFPQADVINERQVEIVDAVRAQSGQ